MSEDKDFVRGKDDKYFLTKTDFIISQVPIGIAGTIKIGSGIKLGNVNDPKHKIVDLLKVTKKQKENINIKNDFITFLDDKKSFQVNDIYASSDVYERSDTEWIENESEERLSKELYINFGAKFGFGDLDAAFSYVENSKQTSHIIIFRRSVEIGFSPEISNIEIDSKYNKQLIEMENYDRDFDRFYKFVNSFGSHYVETMTYGYKISIFAEIKTKDQSKITKFSANLKDLTYNASVNVEQKKFFNENNTVIKALVIGKTSSEVILDNFEKISDFIENLRSGKETMSFAPMTAAITSLSTKLNPNEYPKLFNMLIPIVGEKARSPFGVPSGTIIAWNPKVYDAELLEDLDSFLPLGWKICDGRKYGDFETPNLKDKFIMGTNDVAEVNKSSDVSSHTHSLGAANAAESADKRGGATHAVRDHSHFVSAAEHIPPYWKLIFLIKLSD